MEHWKRRREKILASRKLPHHHHNTKKKNRSQPFTSPTRWGAASTRYRPECEWMCGKLVWLDGELTHAAESSSWMKELLALRPIHAGRWNVAASGCCPLVLHPYTRTHYSFFSHLHSALASLFPQRSLQLRKNLFLRNESWSFENKQTLREITCQMVQRLSRLSVGRLDENRHESRKNKAEKEWDSECVGGRGSDSSRILQNSDMPHNRHRWKLQKEADPVRSLFAKKYTTNFHSLHIHIVKIQLERIGIKHLCYIDDDEYDVHK